MNKQELAEMSGEGSYRKPKSIVLDEIKIQGKEGTFVKTYLTEPKGADGKYRTEDLGESIEVVFLKIRRRLEEKYNPKVKSRRTSEHNSSTDTVMMFGPDAQKGVASDLREKFPNLRTIQVVYCIEKKTGKSVRLIVKGASLGSENKDKEVNSFYDYLGKFGKDEHSYEFITSLSAVAEKSPLGDYYCINFQKGEKLNDKQMEKVSESIKEFHDNIVEQDTFYRSKDEKDIKKEVLKETGEEKDEDAIEYPEEEIDPNDIPF